MRKIFIFLAFISLFNVLPAHTDLDAADQVKMVLAKQKLYAGQYIGALNIYKEVLQKNPEDAAVLHYVGVCNYNLNRFTEAQESLKKAIATNKDVMPESYLILGKIYLADGKIDDALSAFNNYKSTAKSKDAEYEDVAVYIEHCNNAKRLMANPLPVKIENMGSVINSKYDDKTPCISADGHKLVFTTRRPETTDAPTDVEGDGKYFEDIYISLWDTVNHKWQQADGVPGNVNTDAYDAATSISPDGKQIFIYKNDINDNESRGGDIFVSKIVNNKWKTPEPLGKPINTSYWEGGACISSDGKTLFFTSERKGGYGHSDIWMVKRLGKNEWDKPVNLGPDINSEYDEGGVFLAPDGKTLFFCSNGKGSMGSQDIFKSTLENGKWGKPVNLGYPINSERKDGPFVVSADAQTGYFSSDRKGGLGEIDIYTVDLSSIGILEKDNKKKENNGLSILKGVVRDGFEGTGIQGVDVAVLDATGAVIGSTVTDQNGDYFFTLKGNEIYTIKVSTKGYKTVEEKVDLKLGAKETYSLEKQFLLSKDK